MGTPTARPLSVHKVQQEKFAPTVLVIIVGTSWNSRSSLLKKIVMECVLVQHKTIVTNPNWVHWHAYQQKTKPSARNFGMVAGQAPGIQLGFYLHESTLCSTCFTEASMIFSIIFRGG